MDNRVKWIDIAKGFGAIFVLLGHFVLNKEVGIMIYSFHMPLFFFLAGLTFKVKENDSFKSFFKKKVKSIIIPYCIFSVPMFFWKSAIVFVKRENKMLIIKKFIGIFVCWKTKDFYNSLWFLPCIFFVYLMAFFVVKYLKKPFVIFLISLVILVLGLGLDSYNITLPWGIDSSCVVFFFFVLGFVFKKVIYRMQSFLFVLYIPMGIIGYINANISNVKVDIYSNEYGNYALFIISSVLGIVATVGLSKLELFSKGEIMMKLGKNSLYLYGGQILFNTFPNILMTKYNILSINVMLLISMGIMTSCLIIAILWYVKPWYTKIYNKIV